MAFCIVFTMQLYDFPTSDYKRKRNTSWKSACNVPQKHTIILQMILERNAKNNQKSIQKQMERNEQ